ncbi:hypothetical protein GJ496_000042 [Pomphorhynchus laevis]|nr:hypothetical protein GJ496_000042 [Pomphorhynchus laevis]
MSSSKINPKSKVRIRPFTGTMNEQFVTAIWSLLKKAIQQIQNKNNSGLSFEELYRNAYTMVLHKHGEMLYTGLRDVVADHLTTKVRADIITCLENNGDLLQSVRQSWDEHETAMVMIRDILMYMDRVYVQQATGLEHVYNLGSTLFREKVIEQAPINETLTSQLISQITKDRNGESIDRMNVNSVCFMLGQISSNDNRHPVYKELFERSFLDATCLYYMNKSQNLLDTQDASFYLEQTEIILAQEEERANEMLLSYTKQPLLDVIVNEMLTKRCADVLNIKSSGIDNMLKFQKHTDLSRAYRLFRSSPQSLDYLADCVRSFIVKQGTGFCIDLDKSQQSNADFLRHSVETIDCLIQLRKDYDYALSNSFNDDSHFKSKISSAFETIINAGKYGPESLAVYFDFYLRRGNKVTDEEQIMRIIDSAMILFRYLLEKDAFERYYKHYLSRRLLMNRSFSEDREKMVLVKLKSECGSNFTGKLEGMFKDIQISATINDSFHQKYLPLVIDFNCRVLTTGYWPQLPQDIPIELPSNAINVFDQFQEFYLMKHNGRQLKLIHHFSTFELVFRPQNESTRKHILLSSPAQMAILCAFNRVDGHTLKSLMSKTGLEEADCKSCIATLLTPIGGSQILLVNNGVYSVNDSFSSRQVRLKLNQGKRNNSCPTVKQRSDIDKRIMEDRRHEVDASIVRVMKSRHQIHHTALIQEVTNQLKSRFSPDISIIKQRIENLIDREFILKDPNDGKTYTYIA